jgi:4-hydroxy-tetrahydrodipicolinate synthase
MLFKGSMTAIVTPFADGRVDEDALQKHVDFQIAKGVDVIVPCGTTGEAATLTNEEHKRVIKLVVEASSGRALVLAGAGANSTAHAIELTKQARDAGADGTLQVTPYYNKPPQEGLYQHFRSIAEMVELPLILYNVPGRTAINMSAETTLRLAGVTNICGIKEASGDIEQIKKIAAGREADFAILSGDDSMNLDIYRIGGNGCISVTGNIAPDLVSSVWKQFSTGNIDDAQKTQDMIAGLNDAMFIETNPIPVKTALAMMGRCREEFRLPLTHMNEGNQIKLSEILRNTGIIE